MPEREGPVLKRVLPLLGGRVFGGLEDFYSSRLQGLSRHARDAMPGADFASGDAKDEKQLAAVAKLVGKWHCTDMECTPKTPRIYQDLANLAKRANERKVGALCKGIARCEGA